MATIVNNAEIRVTTTGTEKAKAQLTGITGSMASLAKSIGGSLVALLSLQKAWKFINTANAAWGVQAQAVRKVQNVLNSTGQAANYTVKELESLASALQKTSQFGDERILREATATLLRYGSIAKSEFPRVQKLVVDLAAETDDLAGATRLLGISMDDPILGLTRLRRGGVSVNETQQALIRSYVESGDKMKAQAVLLDVLESKFGGNAKAMQTATQRMKNAWGDYLELLGRRTAPVLNGLKLGFALFFEDIIDNSATASEEMNDNLFKGTKAAALNWAKFLIGLKTGLVIFGGIIDSAVTIIVGGIQTTINTAKSLMTNTIQKLWKGLVPQGFGEDILRGLGLSEDFISGISEDVSQKSDILAPGTTFAAQLERLNVLWDAMITNAVNSFTKVETAIGNIKQIGGGAAIDLSGITDNINTQSAEAIENNADALRSLSKAITEFGMVSLASDTKAQDLIDTINEIKKTSADLQLQSAALGQGVTQIQFFEQANIIKAYRDFYKAAMGELDTYNTDEKAAIIRQYEEKINIVNQYGEALRLAQKGLLDNAAITQQEYDANIIEIQKRVLEISAGLDNERIKALNELLKKMADGVTQAQTEIDKMVSEIQDTIVNGFASAFADAIVEGKNFYKSMQKLFKDLVKMILTELAKIAIMKAITAIFTGGGSLIAPTVPLSGNPLPSGGYASFNPSGMGSSSAFSAPTIGYSSADRKLDRLISAIENNKPQVYTQVIKGVPFYNAMRQAELEANVL